MADATWKQNERRVAKKLGGRRIGNTGKPTPDVITGWLAVEVKHRGRLPVWLKDALAQAKRNAGEGRLPLVVLHEKYARDSLVVLTLSDFADWFGWAGDDT